MSEHDNNSTDSVAVESDDGTGAPRRPVGWWIAGVIAVILVAGGVVWWAGTGPEPVDADYRLSSDACEQAEWAALQEPWTVSGKPESASPSHVDDATGLGEISCAGEVASTSPARLDSVVVGRITAGSDAEALARINEQTLIKTLEAGKGAGEMLDADDLSDVCVESKAAVAYRNGDDADSGQWIHAVVGCQSGNMAVIVSVMAIKPRPADQDPDDLLEEILMPLVRDAIATTEQV